MTPLRKFFVLFWIFIGGMLIWQFYSYNHGMDQAQVDHPQQEHFYFYPPATKADGTAQPKPVDGADVRQVNYAALDGQPNPGCFTSHVVLKNVGNAKAINIQIWIRPYRGAGVGDEDVSPNFHYLSDDDPLAQVGEWIAFPDLAPGESSTADVVFTNRPGIHPGKNPNPQINFQTAKAGP